jgi:hypothetical protein
MKWNHCSIKAEIMQWPKYTGSISGYILIDDTESTYLLKSEQRNTFKPAVLESFLFHALTLWNSLYNSGISAWIIAQSL